MKKIVVTIAGECAVGKTTLACAFELFLVENGFTNVTVSDIDRDADCEFAFLQAARMWAINDRHISIVTEQTMKDVKK